MDHNLQNYYENIRKPWGQIFYICVFKQLESFKNKIVLDFGSGFGITANYLAKRNTVVAVEPNKEMMNHRDQDNQYVQINGSMEWLVNEPDQKYDTIICHNVIEYVADRSELIQQFTRILKPDGFISIVKHHKLGKIMHKAVFEYQVDETEALLRQEQLISKNFGTINEYDDSMLEEYSKGELRIEKCYGIRTFYGLQDNRIKADPKWLENMTRIELEVSENPAFREIAFFHHLILKKRRT